MPVKKVILKKCLLSLVITVFTKFPVKDIDQARNYYFAMLAKIELFFLAPYLTTDNKT